MKKKLLSIFLCIIMVAALTAGCASKTEEPNSTENKSETPSSTENKSVETVEKTKVFVSADWVKSLIDGKQPESKDYVIIEAAWGTMNDDKNYLEAHVPGAVHLNTDDIEEPNYWNIRTGDEIKNVMANLGITKDTTVIVYGADSGATRAAFVCLWAGVENVKVIDGGLKAWTNAGYETNKGIENAKATTNDFGVTIPAHPEYVLSMPEDVKSEMDKNNKFRLVSIRSLDEFKGKTSGYSYIEKAGEPQGAVWGHDETDYSNADGSFIDFDKAVAMWNEQGITENNEIAFYCGTGWRASIPWLMAYENGWKNIKLYDGGWFAWQMDPNNPVQAITPEKAAAKYK
ncbi:sulfurtransferase [Tepidibacter aestuarii]|uniref:sulfurtransferase n=1 Tax=Tepidibacter aestuarii TaxID=2925782 RepID=UPI0020C0ACF3|nr:rhodanese-like domain-containing protein [Tepidibacter aestuarii]CAH2215403.1 molybdopterin synthase sulfurtransferase [Tepidibacter aestuarii]